MTKQTINVHIPEWWIEAILTDYSNIKILNEELVKRYLNNASLFLLMWELLKSSIIDSIKNFFISGYENWKWIISDGYNQNVLSLDKSRLKASCIWSVDMQIITQEDLFEIERLNIARNDIAHRLADIVYKENEDINDDDILIIYWILSKVDKWWIENVEIPTDPDLYDKEIDSEGIMSWRMIITNYLLKTHLILTK